MNVGLVTLLLFGSLLVLLAVGMPVAFALAGVTVVYGYLLFGPKSFFIIATHVYGSMVNAILLAIPLFFLMAHMLQHSGIADELYGAVHQWMGGLRGGLAIGTVIICTLFAAMSGISGAATVAMGLIALPAMLKRNYDKRIAVGCIAAGGVLGILIPPSVIMILYAMIARESVGGMFFGGVIPGLVLSSMFITYIGVRSAFQPHMGPPVPPEERVNLRAKIISIKSIILPLMLIVLVLGSIYTGAATPTEAAGVGALGAFICAAIHRRLNWRVILDTLVGTFKVTGMVMWIVAAAAAFNGLYIALGAQGLIIEVVTGLPVSPWAILIGMQVVLFFFGMIMDDFAIVMLCAPIFVPIVRTLGFDTLWFGILFIVNMQMAFLTPPFGYNLFYLRGVAPKGVTMGDIYRSIIPFVGLQALGLVLVMIFPRLALWLPGTMIKK